MLEDQDPLVRRLAVQSARALHARALLLIAKASPSQAQNVENAVQVLMQLEERIWLICDNFFDDLNGKAFQGACLFVAHQIIICTSSSVCRFCRFWERLFCGF